VFGIGGVRGGRERVLPPRQDQRDQDQADFIGVKVIGKRSLSVQWKKKEIREVGKKEKRGVVREGQRKKCQT